MKYPNTEYNKYRRTIAAAANGRIPVSGNDRKRERTASVVTAALEENQPMELNESILEKMDQTNLLLSSIAEALASLASTAMPEAPNFRYPYEAYASDQWLSEIGAVVAERDDYGPAWVMWNRRRWRRHYATGDNGRPPSIWFSRSTADEEGKAEWLTLATFREISDAKPMQGAISAATRAASTETGELTGDADLRSGAKIHALYEDGTEVPDSVETINIYNQFLYKEQRKPANAEELRAWHNANKENGGQKEPS